MPRLLSFARVAALVLLCGFSRLTSAGAADLPRPQPIRALLITGGCCHDYAKQKDILKQGIESRAMVEVTLVHSADKSTKARFDMYDSPDWAKGYDVVIHDECSADVKELPYIDNILNAHKNGVAAVNLHCAMHCYRTGKDDWFQFVGIHSTGHGPQKPIDITFLERSHPVMKGLENWTTINEELYNNETVGDPRYLDLVPRGLLWSVDKLTPEYRQPSAVPKKELVPVNLARGKKATASTSQDGHPPEQAVDGKDATRKCHWPGLFMASGGCKPTG